MQVIVHQENISTLEPQMDINRWSEFIKNHPNGNIFQTPEMYKVYQDTPKYNPFLVIVTDDNNQIQGVLLAVIQKEYKSFIGNLTARSIIFDWN